MDVAPGPEADFDQPAYKDMARAIAGGDEATIRRLIQDGTVPPLAVGRDATNWLIIAILKKQRGSFLTLLTLNALGDPRGKIAGQALYSAIVSDDIWWLKKLHEFGADLNNYGGGNLLLVKAMDTKKNEILEYFLKNGADVNMETSGGGSVALSAADVWRFDLANRFLDLGGSPWVMDKMGATLGFAAEDAATIPAWDHASSMESERRRLLERLRGIGFPFPAPNIRDGRALRAAGKWPQL